MKLNFAALVLAGTSLTLANAECTKHACPFSLTNRDDVHDGRCGEVDAASRMPADIWKDPERVQEYVLATIKWYINAGNGGVKLKQQQCERTGWHQNGTETVSWTSETLMKFTCDTGCFCNYPACPDVPDVPRNHQYCSLCGPKFNAPVEVKYWYRDGPTPGPPLPATGCTKKSCQFSYTNPRNVNGGRCGEVDAAPRMPADIFKDPQRVHEYVGATLQWYHVAGVQLVQSPCNHVNRIKNGTETVSWTSEKLMKFTCDTGCFCEYPNCPDVPDDPRNHAYCSLCGRKFNAPIEVQFWYPSPTKSRHLRSMLR